MKRKLKNSLAVIFSVLILLGAMPLMSVSAESTTANGLVYEIMDGEVTITGYLGTAAELTIPTTIEGYLVTSINHYAFDKCTRLVSIAIPDGIKRINNYAFNGCTSLTSVTIPDSVTSIGDYVFYKCVSLTSVTIPDSLTSIGKGAFLCCTGLSSVAIGDGVMSIGENAFGYCENLTSITIPESVTSIGAGAFYGCESLASITIPDGVTSIGAGAFYGCKSLAYVVIPNSITSVGNRAFYYCDSITDVCFTGTEEQWSAIKIGIDNYSFTGAALHFECGAEEFFGEKKDDVEVFSTNNYSEPYYDNMINVDTATSGIEYEATNRSTDTNTEASYSTNVFIVVLAILAIIVAVLLVLLLLKHKKIFTIF